MKTGVIITIDKEYLPQIHNLARELHQQNNLEVSKVKKYGLIMGTADTGEVSAILRRKEVVNVEQDQAVELPPPDADIQ